MDIAIRIAELSDAQAVHTYYAKLLKEKIPYIRDNPIPSVEDEIKFVQNFVDGPGDLLLVLDGSEVIGMLGMERSGHYQESHRIHIGISIQKEYRVKGLGTQLLNKANEWAANNSIHSIELEVIASNPAVKLYKSLGYNVVGRISNGYKVNNEYYDVLHMQLIL